MVKPKKKSREAFDFHQVIRHIEEKYKFDHRDVLNSSKTSYDITVRYNKETGSNINGNTQFSSPEYKAFLAWVAAGPSGEKKGILNLIEKVPYLDFWHWLLEECFFECHNGCYESLPVKSTVDKVQEAPDWVKTIFGYLETEFGEDADEDGYISVWIEW